MLRIIDLAYKRYYQQGGQRKNSRQRILIRKSGRIISNRWEPYYADITPASTLGSMGDIARITTIFQKFPSLKGSSVINPLRTNSGTCATSSTVGVHISLGRFLTTMEFWPCRRTNVYLTIAGV